MKAILNGKYKYLLIIAAVVLVIVLVVALVLSGSNDTENLEEQGGGTEDSTSEDGKDGSMDIDPSTVTQKDVDKLLEETGEATEGGNEIEPTDSTPSTTSYDNSKQLMWRYNSSGDCINIGLGDSEVEADCIYLNLRASITKSTSYDVGYYITSSSSLFKYGSVKDTLEDEGDTNLGISHRNYIIKSVLWDDLVPADYGDESDYGVAWYRDSTSTDEGPYSITVRAVNLDTGSLIDIFEIEISLDKETGKYMLSGVYSADVADTGELDATTREDCLDKAIEYFATTYYAENLENMGEDWKGTAKVTAIVDKSGSTYFPKLVNTDEETARRTSDYPYCVDTYAVTFYLPLYGYVTIYLAPTTQLYMQTTSTTAGGKDAPLEVYGHDVINPRSATTVLAPTDYFDA